MRKIYTEQERKEARRINKRNWFIRHGHEPQNVEKRRILEQKWRERNREKVTEKNRRYVKQRLISGKCAQCNSPRIPNHKKSCERHWFANVAGDHFRKYSMKYGEELKAIMERQNYKCPYTGKDIGPGFAHLDHILPKSRFPELNDDLNNLQWVAPEVNLSKANLTHEEFVAMCKIIATRFP